MKMCQEHWDRLREAIRLGGMEQLVPKSGQEAAARMAESLDEETAENFDPLMSAHNSISAHALESGGLYLLQDEYCPLCEANKHLGEHTDTGWIQHAVEEAKNFCRQHKLIGTLH